MQPYAEYIVASQEVVAGDGYNHATTFTSLATRPDLTSPATLAAGIVRSFEAEHRGEVFQADTYSAVATAQLNTFAAALKQFTDEAVRLVEVDPSTWLLLFRNARRSASSFLNRPEYRDIGQFLDEVTSQSPVGSELKANADDFRRSVFFQNSNDRRNSLGRS